VYKRKFDYDDDDDLRMQDIIKGGSTLQQDIALKISILPLSILCMTTGSRESLLGFLVLVKYDHTGSVLVALPWQKSSKRHLLHLFSSCHWVKGFI